MVLLLLLLLASLVLRNAQTSCVTVYLGTRQTCALTNVWLSSGMKTRVVLWPGNTGAETTSNIELIQCLSRRMYNLRLCNYGCRNPRLIICVRCYLMIPPRTMAGVQVAPEYTPTPLTCRHVVDVTSHAIDIDIPEPIDRISRYLDVNKQT